MNIDLKNKPRKELIQIIQNLESTGLRTVKFPTKKEIENWSYSFWEDKEGMTSGVVDAKNYAQRIMGAAYVLWYMKNDIFNYQDYSDKIK